MKETAMGEPLEIPSNWKFPERNEKGLEVKQIDLDQRFLALTLPNVTGYIEKRPNYRGEYVDYFFGENGKAIECRKHNYSNTAIWLRKSDMEMYFLMDDDSLDHHSEINGIWLFEPDSNAEILEPVYGDRTLAYLNFDSISNKDIHCNRLHSVALGGILRGKAGNKIEIPDIAIDLINPNRRNDGLNTSCWEYWKPDGNLGFVGNKNFKSDMGEQSNEVVFRDKKGDIVFRVNWKVEDGKLIIAETHLPTQITRILSVSVILPMDEVEEAVFSRPPYEKAKDRLSGSEDLVVPWREIDRIMGVSLFYSHPTPPKKT